MPPPDTERSGAWSTLRRPGFGRLVVGHALSSTAQTLGMAAIGLIVYQRTGSTAWVALAAAAHLLPHLAASGLAGVVADRRDRLGLLRTSSAARAGVSLLLAAAVAVTSVGAAVILGLVAVIAVLGTPAYPALVAVTGDVVPADEVLGATAAVVTVDALAFVAGPALGGALLLVGSPVLVLIGQAVLFAAGWACLAGRQRALRPNAVAPAATGGGVVRDLVEAVRTLTASGRLAAPMALLVVVNLLYGLTVVLLVPVATDLLASGRSGVGILNLAIGIGSVAGALACSRLARRSKATVEFVTLVGTGAPLALLAVLHQPDVATALMVLSGAASMVGEVVATGWLRQAVPSALAGRTFGVLESLALGSMLLGTLAAPVLVEVVGLRTALLVVGLGVPAAALAAVTRVRHSLYRDADVSVDNGEARLHPSPV